MDKSSQIPGKEKALNINKGKLTSVRFHSICQQERD